MVPYLWMSISEIKTPKNSSPNPQKKTPKRRSPRLLSERKKLPQVDWFQPRSLPFRSLHAMVFDFVEDMDFTDFVDCIWHHMTISFRKVLDEVMTFGLLVTEGAVSLCWGPGALGPGHSHDVVQDIFCPWHTKLMSNIQRLKNHRDALQRYTSIIY